MTRCEEFYEKVEKDGNFCGMKNESYRQLMAYKAFLKVNPKILGLTENAAKDLIREPNEDVKQKAIVKIGKALEDGNKVTGKQVKEYLNICGHEDKVKEERIPTEEDKIKLTENFVKQATEWGMNTEEILRRVEKALTFS